MSGPPISGQWSLNTTGHDLVSISKGILRAATTDNVQAGALAVAEAFGATLAISGTILLKVESELKKQRSSRMVGFMKSTIGYMSGDSASHLSTSDGGMRFLSLAAALICTSGHFFGAQALDQMIRDTRSAKEPETLATVRQLQDLLVVLDHRLGRMDFANEVVGFQALVGRGWYGTGDAHPSLKVLTALVEGFRSIARLGDGDEVHISIYNAIPWTAAFTKWCLGLPPKILSQDGATIIDQPESKVTIRMNGTTDIPEEIRVTHGLKSPSILWSSRPATEDRPLAWTGMLDVQSYGIKHLYSLELGGDQIKPILHQVLSHSLPKVISNLWPTSTWPWTDDRPFHPGIEYPKLEEYRASLFAPETTIARTAAEYYGASKPFDFHRDVKNITTLQTVSQHENALRKKCPCLDCVEKDGSGYTAIGVENPVRVMMSTRCKIEQFRYSIAIITAEILALSLFDFTEPAKVFWPGTSVARERTRGQFTATIRDILFSTSEEDQPSYCLITHILDLATSLIGHQVSPELESGTWIASSGRGQVLYPFLFETGILQRSGLLMLGGGPGNLVFRGSKFDRVLSKKPDPTITPENANHQEIQVDRLLNLYPTETLKWQVHAADDCLELFFGPTSYRTMFNPFDVLTTASRSLFVDCHHDPSIILQRPDVNCEYSRTLPFQDLLDPEQYTTSKRTMQKVLDHVDDKREIIPVFSNEQLRFFSMVSPFPGVVRTTACLQCCINICVEARLPYIVI